VPVQAPSQGRGLPETVRPPSRIVEAPRQSEPPRSIGAHEPGRPIERAPSGGNERNELHAGPVHGGTPPLEGHRVQLSPTASVVANPAHPGFTAVNRLSPHASLVVEQHVDARGQTHVNSYRQTMSADGRTTTRVYTDGRRTVDGATFHSTGLVSGPQYLTYHNGLRAAYLPNGRPLYAETFVSGGAHVAGGDRVVQRTIYAASVGGEVREFARPIRRYYTVMPFGGYDTYVYRPLLYGAAVFAVLYAPFAFPIAVGPQCVICPQPGVEFAAPPERYSDPIELLGDMQVADAVGDQGVPPVDESTADPAVAGPTGEDGPMPPDQAMPADQSSLPQDAPPPPPPPPELTSADAGTDPAELDRLRQQAGELQAQAAAHAPVIPAAAGANDAQGAASAVPAVAVSAGPPAAAADATATIGDTLAVPEDVRTQIHKEVRLSVAQHVHDHPLTLIDIMASGYSRIYLFQVAGAIDTTSIVTGDGCALGSGDLLAFSSLDDAQKRPTAQMKVVAARPGHCLSHDTVEVSIGDLQDMLNTFNQRLEANMHKLQACAATKGSCAAAKTAAVIE
jgi:hypothetical protein